MKKLFLAAMLVLAATVAMSNPIRYFTRSQAARVVTYLNSQDELMIYCGYEYEIETYVLINEVWAEPFNSAYYEIWVYGYDAYTGDEVYMPLDMACVWLFSNNKIYSAARYLRFRTTAQVPPIKWYVPSYNSYVRTPHRTGQVRTYHYDVHTYGWMPPAPPKHQGPHYDGPHHDGPHHHDAKPPLPPYYMRTPQTPAPKPENKWTPGTDRPVVVNHDIMGGNVVRPSGRVSTPTNGSGDGTGSNSGTRGVTVKPAPRGSTQGGTVTNDNKDDKGGKGGDKPKPQDPKKTEPSATKTTTNTRTTTTTTQGSKNNSSSATATHTRPGANNNNSNTGSTTKKKNSTTATTANTRTTTKTESNSRQTTTTTPANTRQDRMGNSKK
ncbi:MAG: hypothetical protein K5650_06990 [Bacteroidales bacterium]|nr:hypothetical protein [Bacteroidales bacterium]